LSIKPFHKGDKVRDIHTGKEYTVVECFWQPYAGGDTADYTIVFEREGDSQPWNKSRNLELVERQKCN